MSLTDHLKYILQTRHFLNIHFIALI